MDYCMQPNSPLHLVEYELCPVSVDQSWARGDPRYESGRSLADAP